ncbi:hypothetical protein TTHERM_00581810 (macronuclear) [Tetrahymena thermophila SB210]|uniref:Uncharacterized protein n=1 Tax=Tetrahymena thermophila (strain SB210) TaxID=312017 RepID=Q23QA7_TETTS|nr:hypothetical protein TTHERM_00581810 [Tetrahymena thermophila SB210]EAR98677.2 hypothetical protein TTHERM_00581810 [Tetrahymena thermophila SB210]|eukprot:XP_001018922.2 hypothetical protein TTHERM_00581810 [Tetrahymena thermophila SB210]
MKKHTAGQTPQSLCNLESAFDDELEVEDEDSEQQRQNRIQMLQNQDKFWTSCLAKQNNNSDPQQSKGAKLYQEQHQISISPENYDNYFKKYNGMSAKLILLQDMDDSDSDDHKENKDEQQQDELSFIRNMSIQSIEERTVPKIMSIKLATIKREPYKISQGTDEFETPTPCDDDEDKNISHHMKHYSMPQKVNGNNSPYLQSQADLIKKFNSDKNNQEKHERFQSVPKKHVQQPLVSPFNHQMNTPSGNLETPNDDFNINDSNQNSDNFMKAYLEQQQYLQQQAQQNGLDQSVKLKQLAINPSLTFEENRQQSIREMMKSNSTEGYDEITPLQRQYFASQHFKELLVKYILPDLLSSKDFYDNENYIIILKDVKWNRIYLKKLNMYLQIRMFSTREQYSVYMDSYQKIVTKFIKFMPQTVYSDDKTFTIIQKLGDFSLYDLSNLILIEAKQHDNINYQKYYLQMLSNLFDSLILILFHNYYIGNINPKNIFVSKAQNQFVIKFSNLVDFSFDYSQICDKNYACIFQKKPTEIEIWFSELYSCCRCMQEMMDRDKYYLQKKNVKEFIARHKNKYQKIMNILSFFLLRNDSMRNGVNFDVIQQFILSSFEDSERIIQLSDRSIKHIQYMIQTSKMHLYQQELDLNNKIIEQKLFFFMQQIHFHQDFEDDEIQYIVRFINRMLYKHLFDKNEESQIFYLLLENLITDATVFRRNKNLQKTTYMIYVLYLLKCPSKIEKCIAYWRYMSQTTSLVDQQNPISLYYVGLYNLYLLENQKALKYFQYAYNCKDFSEDIILNQPKNLNKRNEEEIDSEEDEKDNRNNYISQKSKSPIISSKPKKHNPKAKRHSLFSQNNNQDNFILKVREAYGYLGLLKFTFAQEGNAKRIQQILYEAKGAGLISIIEKLLQMELNISANLKQFFLQKSTAKSQYPFFVEQIIQVSSFNANNFIQIGKSVQNSATLTESFKSQFQQYQSNDSLVYRCWNLFYAQTQIQILLTDKVVEAKKIPGLSNDKLKGRTIGSYNNLDSRGYSIDNY